MIELIPAFRGQLQRLKATSPPGRWRPYLGLSFVTRQGEDDDRWVAWLKWQTMEAEGAFPCRDASKHEWISRMDPPDSFLAQSAAEQFAERCMESFREQFKAWIKSDFGTGEQL
jgi:hypothetical protein